MAGENAGGATGQLEVAVRRVGLVVYIHADLKPRGLILLPGGGGGEGATRERPQLTVNSVLTSTVQRVREPAFTKQSSIR